MKAVLFVALAALSPGLAAQQPTAAQVQQALQQPGVADQVRSRMVLFGAIAQILASTVAIIVVAKQ